MFSRCMTKNGFSLEGMIIGSEGLTPRVLPSLVSYVVVGTRDLGGEVLQGGGIPDDRAA